jgi:hypothetical protein
MAVTTYEALSSTDTTTTRTLLHESIPLTGTIISGTYNEENIKNYTHGQFQSVYDYPFLSSSANHIFDITVGYDESSPLSGSTGATLESKKINMYNQFSQVLLGYTSSNNDVRKFELDLDLDEVNVLPEAYFIPLSRLITKDQIKEGTVSITLGTGSHANPFALRKTLTDASASATSNTKAALGGEYGLLYESDVSTESIRGLVFYQAGMVVLSTSSFDGVTDFHSSSGTAQSIADVFVSSSISGACDALRRRIQNISFNNTTEINSSIYFCRIPSNNYNHSANPSYVSGSKIRVKDVESDTPVSYITTVGLYSSDNTLMAIAKLSEPLKKDPTNQITLRVRLDY